MLLCSRKLADPRKTKMHPDYINPYFALCIATAFLVWLAARRFSK